ncbi:MAG: hypothetical protein ACYCTV_00755 [Leptospirales bacterium]
MAINLLGLTVFLYNMILFPGIRVAKAIDLNVITNQTSLFFKVSYIPLGARNLDPKVVNFANRLIQKDLEESGYFELVPVSLNIQRSLSNLLLTGDNAKELSGTGVEGVVGAQIIRDDLGVHLIGIVRDPVNGSVLLSRKYTTTGNIRVAVHRFVDDIIFQFTGFKGVADSRIAFVGKNHHRGYDLYVMDFDGEGLHRLTWDRVLAYSPAWSIHRHLLAYTSYLHGTPQILIYDLSTGRKKPLAHFPGLNITPVFSRNAEKLAMALSKSDRTQNTELYSYSMNSGKFDRITFTHSNNLSPSWSPDGRQISFVSDRDGHPQIFVMDSDGSNVRRISFEGFYNVSPSWSPQGDLIAYVCMNQNHRPKICLTTPDGERHIQLTHGEGQDDSPDWSSDGRTIIFTHQIRGHSVIEKMFLDGTHVHRLGAFSRSVITPVWAVR